MIPDRLPARQREMVGEEAAAILLRKEAVVKPHRLSFSGPHVEADRQPRDSPGGCRGGLGVADLPRSDGRSARSTGRCRARRPPSMCLMTRRSVGFDEEIVDRNDHATIGCRGASGVGQVHCRKPWKDRLDQCRCILSSPVCSAYRCD